MHELDSRLQAVMDLVPAGVPVADIGTDHGYLPAALLESGKSPFVYACDLREGPLDSAIHTLSGFPTDCWKAILCDGLSAVPTEADTIVLAGMGFDVILGILDQAKTFWEKDRTFIIQPMSGQERLRSSLAERGFEALAEKAAISNGKRYTIIAYRYTGHVKALTPGQAACGLYLYKKPESTAEKCYLKGRYDWLKRVIDGCNHATSATSGNPEKLEQAKKALAELLEHQPWLSQQKGESFDEDC